MEKNCSVYVCLYIIWASNIGFSIVIPSLWSYLQDLEAEHSFLGWTIAMFSVGRFLSSPCLGYLSNKLSLKTILFGVLCIDMIGNLLYFMGGNKFFILFARFLCGIGAACSAPISTFFSSVSSHESRSSYMAKIGVVITISFIVGPAIGSMLSLLPSFQVMNIQVNAYNSPALLNILLLLIGMILLAYLFKVDAIYETIQEENNFTRISTHPPKLLVVIFLFLQFVAYSTVAIYETITTPLTENNFEWGVTENTVLWVVIGIISALSFVLLRFYKKLLSDEQVLLLTLLFVSAAFFILSSLGKNIGITRFVIGTTIVCLSFPLVDVQVQTVYSKLLGDIPQGMYFGIFESTGAISRIVGPLWSVSVYSSAGEGYVFLVEGTMHLTGIVLLILFWSRIKGQINRNFVEKSTAENPDKLRTSPHKAVCNK
eukprot:TRINITY_DN5290_c0_g1_i1.p1 TRINITY_DN5290_c0_g1~~TRINITY_DN5290_c0_g1_i1.p1  ORF type:complete len:428 (+),score=28.09 TRINITY_DN5290_c0_g1_i1:105-1388(+)